MLLKKLINFKKIRESNPKELIVIITQSYISGVIDTLVASGKIKIPTDIPVKNVIYFVISRIESDAIQDIIRENSTSMASPLIDKILK